MHQADSAAASPQESNITEGRFELANLDRQSVLKWVFLLLPIGYLCFRLINNLRVEWTTNPQYSYGWAVPLLCAGLLVRRWHAIPEKSCPSTSDLRPPTSGHLSVVLLFALLAFLYLPTRLIEEATPEWRLIQWSLGFEAIGLTLCAIFLGSGRGWLRQVAFPICFFFVAIPWPTIIEAPVIQSLTRINSAITVELLGWTGIPAIQHGNLIEVSTGTVGVSEACSGIRSFQTSLMVSLFFGEFYRMKMARRLLLVSAGFVLAMAFNVCRMSFLTMIAAKKGIAAIAQYHDPAGIMITVVCTAGLWGLALLFRKKSEVRSQKSEVGGQLSLAREMATPISQGSLPSPGLFRLSLGLLTWLIVVEIGVQLWYRSVESHPVSSPKWTMAFPTNNSSFKSLPISPTTENLLRFDEGRQGAWSDPDGSSWEAFYFNWWPGRVAGYLAKRHTPEICLPATGAKLLSGPQLTIMNINGVELPVRSYVFDTEGRPMYVFHCRWEAGVNADAYVAHDSARFNFVRAIWAGRGNKGQKVLEIIVSGYADSERAKAALLRQLQTMIKVEKPEEKS
jgi:exosortase